MDKKKLIKILIAVVAVLLVAVIALVVIGKVKDKGQDDGSSELVSPSVSVPVGENAENNADSMQGWNEGGTLVQGDEMESTSPQMPDEQPGEVETLADPETIDITDLAVDDRALLVINAQHKLPAEYVPHLEETVTGSGVYLEAKAAEAFMEMYMAALGQGLTLTPYSGYVSFDRQNSRHSALAEDYMEMGYSEAEAQALAARKILPAGCSEHNAGLAVDLGSNRADFTDSAEYKWLVKNAADYGFIERYTGSFEDETGVDAAPWHWRYVGSASMAKAINDSDLSFEEWMAIEYPYWEDPEATQEEDDVLDENVEGDEAEDETEAEVEEESIIDIDELPVEGEDIPADGEEETQAEDAEDEEVPADEAEDFDA